MFNVNVMGGTTVSWSTEGLPGVWGNKGTKRKYHREQGNMTPVLGNTGTKTSTFFIYKVH